MFLEAQHGTLSIAKKTQEPSTGFEQGWKGGSDTELAHKGGISSPRQEWEDVPQERQTCQMQSFE